MAEDDRKPSADSARELIEIRDPEIDAAQVMEQVRERVRQRRAELGQPRTDFPVFGAAELLARPDDSQIDANLYHYLELANKSYNQFETGANLQLSPATRIPILGRVWSLVRRQAHELVLFYVNRNIEHQVAVNQQMVSALNLLTTSLEEQQRQIWQLEKEIEELRSGADG
jgi:hypothetical protein